MILWGYVNLLPTLPLQMTLRELRPHCWAYRLQLNPPILQPLHQPSSKPLGSSSLENTPLVFCWGGEVAVQSWSLSTWSKFSSIIRACLVPPVLPGFCREKWFAFFFLFQKTSNSSLEAHGFASWLLSYKHLAFHFLKLLLSSSFQILLLFDPLYLLSCSAGHCGFQREQINTIFCSI